MDHNAKKLSMKEVKPKTPELGLEPQHMIVVEKKW
jgi:hypothetical protein